MVAQVSRTPGETWLEKPALGTGMRVQRGSLLHAAGEAQVVSGGFCSLASPVGTLALHLGCGGAAPELRLQQRGLERRAEHPAAIADSLIVEGEKKGGIYMIKMLGN